MMDLECTSNSTSKSFRSWSANLAYSQSYIQKLSQFLNTVLNLHRNDGFSAFIQTYVQMFPFLVCDKRHNSPRSTTFKAQLTTKPTLESSAIATHYFAAVPLALTSPCQEMRLTSRLSVSRVAPQSNWGKHLCAWTGSTAPRVISLCGQH